MARDPHRREERDSEFVDKLVHINRVAKVVKGGRRFGFAALVVVGDQKGRVGFGHGKAREVPEAIRKATEAAKRGLTRVPLGMQDVVAKSIGTSNPYNVVRATFDALKRQDSPRSVAARRNVKVSALQARRRDVDAADSAAD
jgi:small subunit ribosomal protein S5